MLEKKQDILEKVVIVDQAIMLHRPYHRCKIEIEITHDE